MDTVCCPGCGRRLNLPPHVYRAQCPACGRVFQPADPPLPAIDEQHSVEKSSTQVQRGQPRKSAANREEETDAVTQRAKRIGRIGFVLGTLWALGGVLTSEGGLGGVIVAPIVGLFVAVALLAADKMLSFGPFARRAGSPSDGRWQKTVIVASFVGGTVACVALVASQIDFRDAGSIPFLVQVIIYAPFVGVGLAATIGIACSFGGRSACCRPSSRLPAKKINLSNEGRQRLQPMARTRQSDLLGHADARLNLARPSRLHVPSCPNTGQGTAGPMASPC